MKYYLAVILLLMSTTSLKAAVVGFDSVQPTWEDGGNDWRSIQVGLTTTSFTPISVYPSSATNPTSSTNTFLNINEWRKREIVNTSNVPIMLWKNGTDFSSFISTIGVVLYPDPRGFGYTAGDSWLVPHQDQVWGIMSSSTPAGVSTGTFTGGCGGYETWWNEKKKSVQGL